MSFVEKDQTGQTFSDKRTGEAPAGSHRWRFFRAGGFDQVRLDSGPDLMALDQLDQKLWVALSCPTGGLEFDSRTLELLDADNNGRIHVPEIIAAVKWAGGMLKDPGQLLTGGSSLPLAAINDATPEGKQVLASAKQILANLGKGEAKEISLDDTTDTVRIFAQTNFNGDGIIPADAAGDDDETKQVICYILACLGAETDRSGKPGVDKAKVDQFFAEAQAFSDWWAQAETAGGDILPLGDDTICACALLKAVKTKIDDYFARCRLASFDARALSALNRQESEYLALAAKDMTIDAAEIAGFPLALIEAGRPLPLRSRVNPAWAVAIGRFAEKVVTPLLGERAELTEKDWDAILARFKGFDAWCAQKVGASVEKLGLKPIREILRGPSRERITALLAQDKALEAEANSIEVVDKLVRFNRDLYRLLRNFVNFRDFYGRREKAVFQAGTLYLDQRSCDLCVRVDDMAKHGAMAHLSRTCLVYCDLVRKGGGDKMTIAAAFTAGDSDHLMVGRNGLFYDRKGQDWDATVVKIVENPISLRQAFWAPYKRALRWVEEQVAKRAAAADSAAHEKLTSTVGTVGQSAQQGKPAAPAKLDIGVVAALGVAVGGITAALGMLLQAFFGLGIWMPLGFVALILLISGPSMIIAWLKVRQRNIGPILDANGWAVNARAKINIKFGRSLTAVAKLPPGSSRDLRDPYADRRFGWLHLIVIVVLLCAAAWACWNYGVVERVAPGVFPKSHWLNQHQAK